MPGADLTMSIDRAGMMVGEWFDVWNRYYLPTSIPLDGKTVLNVGAGEGETAAFFFSRGAKRVICVEPDPRRASRLLVNAEKNSWNCRVIQEKFSADHMVAEPFDFMEMDCEGCEAALLDPALKSRLGSFPCTIEVHTPKLLAEFLRDGRFYVAKTWGNTSIVRTRSNDSASEAGMAT
jgi:protein-L-isoaspartate O-methyltransferase